MRCEQTLILAIKDFEECTCPRCKKPLSLFAIECPDCHGSSRMALHEADILAALASGLHLLPVGRLLPQSESLLNRTFAGYVQWAKYFEYAVVLALLVRWHDEYLPLLIAQCQREADLHPALKAALERIQRALKDQVSQVGAAIERLTQAPEAHPLAAIAQRYLSLYREFTAIPSDVGANSSDEPANQLAQQLDDTIEAGRKAKEALARQDIIKTEQERFRKTLALVPAGQVTPDLARVDDELSAIMLVFQSAPNFPLPAPDVTSTISLARPRPNRFRRRKIRGNARRS